MESRDQVARVHMHVGCILKIRLTYPASDSFKDGVNGMKSKNQELEANWRQRWPQILFLFLFTVQSTGSLV